MNLKEENLLQMREQAVHSFDFLLDTISSSSQNISIFINIHGVLCLVGPITKMPGFHSGELISSRKSVAGSAKSDR